MMIDNCRDYYFWLLKLFIKVICPRLKKSTEDIKKRAKTILVEIEELGFCILHVLPGLLFLDSNEYLLVTEKIQSGLFSSEKEEIELAIVGLCYWLMYANTDSILAPQSNLLDTLINLITMRKIPGLDVAIDWISGLIRNMPDLLTENHRQLLYIALTNLLQETELPLWNHKQMNLEDNSIILEEERSYIRIKASELAYQMYVTFEGQQENIPSILTKWKQDSEKSIYPEIKRIWM